MTKIAVACAVFSSKPVCVSRGTAIIPPPPPNKLFAVPTKPPQSRRFPAKILLFSIVFPYAQRARPLFMDILRNFFGIIKLFHAFYAVNACQEIDFVLK